MGGGWGTLASKNAFGLKRRDVNLRTLPKARSASSTFLFLKQSIPSASVSLLSCSSTACSQLPQPLQAFFALPAVVRRSPAPAVRGAVPVAGHLEGEVAWVRAGVQQLGAGQLLRVGQRGLGRQPQHAQIFRPRSISRRFLLQEHPQKMPLGQPWNAPEPAQNAPEPLYYPPGRAPLNQPHQPLIKAGKVV